MKKTLSLILSAVLILSTLITLIIPASAEGEGDWDVMLKATSVEQIPSKNPPLPGYYYDETGFHTISPDYTNFDPDFTVISKEMYNIENFSMTIVIHDYCIMGDNWISFSVWSESNGLAQGNVSGKYGDGWTSLIRPNPTTGELNRFESWNATKGGRSGNQVFTPIDNTQLAPITFEEVLDDNGDRVITFSIEDGVVKVNGSAVGSGTDKCISERFKDGLAYIGVTLHNTDHTGKYHPTISITDVNGEIPTGTGSREPERDICILPPAPTTPPPYGQPAIWFDATLSNSNYKMPDHTGCELTNADNNTSFLVNLKGESFQISFDVREEIIYDASDFPYFAIIFKNFCTCDIPEGGTPFEYCYRYIDQMTVWYYAGENTAPNENGVIQVDECVCINPRNEDGSSAVDDYYTVAIFEINDPEYWSGRIHGFRLDVNGLTNYAEEGHDTIEILGTGFFRSGMEIVEYIGDMQADGKNFNINSIIPMVWNCHSQGHYDAGNGDELCDACWTATWRCDDCDILTGGGIIDRCESCGKPHDCDENRHVDKDQDDYCDLCWESLLPFSEETTIPSVVIPTPVETDIDTEEDTPSEETEPDEEKTTQKKDDIYDDSDAPIITIGGCEMSASLGVVSLVAIIGAGIVIKKKED